MKPKVLLLSVDPALGESRRLLMEKNGCSVTAMVGETVQISLPKHLTVDIVVVGHEVPNDGRVRIVEAIRKHMSKAKIVFLDASMSDEWLKSVLDAASPR
jgi:DNA-binding NarL/FixJ family response regulator